MNIKDQIAAARTLADAAESGPWTHNGRGEVWQVDGYDAGDPNAPDTRVAFVHHAAIKVGGRIVSSSDANSAFIAASRTLVPQLADALERACELLEKQTGRKIGCECKTCDGDYRRAVDREIDALLAGEVKP